MDSHDREPHAGKWALQCVRIRKLRDVRTLLNSPSASATVKRMCQVRLESTVKEWHALLKDAGVRQRFGRGRPGVVTPEQIAQL